MFFITTTTEGDIEGGGATEGHNEGQESAVFLIFIVLLIASMLAIKLVHKIHLKYNVLPESAIILLLGLIVGLIDHLLGGNMKKQMRFDRSMFEYFILPPIIFESGFALESKGMFKNLGTILLHAIIGTLISTVTISTAIFLIGRYTSLTVMDPDNPIESFVFGTILSAVDPVATLAIFTEVFGLAKSSSSSPPLLYNLVFGESVLNDAVSIVLYTIFLDYVGHTHVTASNIAAAIGSFFWVSICSLLVGCLFAIATAMLFKHVRFNDMETFELLLIILFGFTSYIVAESLSLSGIMSLFFCGVIMRHYTWYNLSTYSQLTVQKTLKVLSTAADMFVFCLLGLAVFTFSGIHDWNWGFIFLSIGLCFASRALNIFPLALLSNIGRKRKIKGKQMFVLWFSGLRGAIAFALALETLSYRSQGLKHAPQIVTTTLMVVIFTVVVQGGLTHPLLALLGMVPSSSSSEESGNSEDEETAEDKYNNIVDLVKKTQQDKEQQQEREKKRLIKKSQLPKIFLKNLDKKYLHPVLRRSGTRQERLFRKALAQDSSAVFALMEVNVKKSIDGLKELERVELDSEYTPSIQSELSEYQNYLPPEVEIDMKESDYEHNNNNNNNNIQ